MLWMLKKNRFVIFGVSIFVTLAFVFFDRRQRYHVDTIHADYMSNTVTPELIAKIDELKRKLKELEFSNSARSQEIIKLKDQLKKALPANDTETSLTLPSIYSALPHLIAHPEGLIPSLQVSKDRKGVTLAFGIPTVRREHRSYLIPTIDSMLQGLTEEDKDDVVIIIFVGDKSPLFAKQIASQVKSKFPDSVNSGLLEIIAPPSSFYPDMNSLPLTFNDPLERVQWRTKQNLDYSFLMMYAQNKARFYVQMEDDIIASPSYAMTIKTFALQQDTANWFMLEFSALGFIGKLFRSSDLGLLIEFFILFHKDKPIDWLLDHVLWVKVCNPEKDAKHCRAEKSRLKIKFKPSLFQHIGQESSLKGKRQALIDKDFKQQPLFQAHLNPKAIIKSTFEVYQQFTPEKAYLGQSFYWGLTPHAGEVMRFCFINPVELERVKIQTGNIEHPGDILLNATVEILTAATKKKRDMDEEPNDLLSNDGLLLEGKIRNEYRVSDYITVGRFDQRGVADHKIPLNIGAIAEVRIRVIDHTQENWIIISEIHIVKRKGKRR